MTKSEARKVFLHFKTYMCIKISETIGNLYTTDTSKQRTLDVCPKLSVIWRFHCSKHRPGFTLETTLFFVCWGVNYRPDFRKKTDQIHLVYLGNINHKYGSLIFIYFSRACTCINISFRHFHCEPFFIGLSFNFTWTNCNEDVE